MIEKMKEMYKQEKNIPLTREEIKSLPYGFTETAVYPTANFNNRASKFIPPSPPKFKKNG